MATLESIAALTGESIWLTVDYDTHKARDKFTLQSAQKVGDKIYVVGQKHGTKGLWCPLSMVSFQDPSAPAAPPKEAPSPPLSSFGIPGYESDSILMEMFKAFAPVSEAAVDLYMLYQSEYGELDTDVLVQLLSKVGLSLGDPWPEAKIKQMHIHLTAALTAADLGGIPEADLITLEPPYQEVDDEQPDTSMYQNVGDEHDMEVAEIADKKGPGRPRGSRNKPKEESPVVIPHITERPVPDQGIVPIPERSKWKQYYAADLMGILVRLAIDHPDHIDSIVEEALDMAKRAVS